jgi:hypothetical protein
MVITSSIDPTFILQAFLHCISNSCEFCNILFDNLDFKVLMFFTGANELFENNSHVTIQFTPFS